MLAFGLLTPLLFPLTCLSKYEGQWTDYDIQEFDTSFSFDFESFRREFAV